MPADGGLVCQVWRSPELGVKMRFSRNFGTAVQYAETMRQLEGLLRVDGPIQDRSDKTGRTLWVDRRKFRDGVVLEEGLLREALRMAVSMGARCAVRVVFEDY